MFPILINATRLDPPVDMWPSSLTTNLKPPRTQHAAAQHDHRALATTNDRCPFDYIPVIALNPATNTSFAFFAFLDSGSNVTVLNPQLATMLGYSTKSLPSSLQTANKSAPSISRKSTDKPLILFYGLTSVEFYPDVFDVNTPYMLIGTPQRRDLGILPPVLHSHFPSQPGGVM